LTGFPEKHLPEEFLEKREGALKVIEDCRRKNGFYASTQRYPELWLRDLVYSEDVLLSLGYVNDVENHLTEFAMLQRASGQLPTVIAHGINRLIRRRYQGCSCDTEILFVIGMCKLAHFLGRQFKEQPRAIKSSVGFIENKLDEHHLIQGMDWRDAMPTYIGKYLLSNQMLLADMFELLGNYKAADIIKANVNEFFVSEKLCFYADSIYWENGNLKQDLHFDCLGNALAILNNTASGKISNGILKSFGAAKTRFGYRNIAPNYEFNRTKLHSTWDLLCSLANGAFLRNKPGIYQNSAIWPFVEIRVIEALKKLGAVQDAEEAVKVMFEREGFSEFYDPVTGLQGGSKGQLWTSAAVLEAVNKHLQ
jgi:hypothetical protein